MNTDTPLRFEDLKFENYTDLVTDGLVDFTRIVFNAWGEVAEEPLYMAKWGHWSSKADARIEPLVVFNAYGTKKTTIQRRLPSGWWDKVTVKPYVKGQARRGRADRNTIRLVPSRIIWDVEPIVLLSYVGREEDWPDFPEEARYQLMCALLPLFVRPPLPAGFRRKPEATAPEILPLIWEKVKAADVCIRPIFGKRTVAGAKDLQRRARQNLEGIAGEVPHWTKRGERELASSMARLLKAKNRMVKAKAPVPPDVTLALTKGAEALTAIGEARAALRRVQAELQAAANNEGEK